MNETIRDEELGALLRELDAPEHRPAFHRELRAALARERATVRRRRWRVRGAVALAAAAVVAVLAAVLLPHRAGGPATANAAFVQAKLRSALETMRSLSGVLVEVGPAQVPARRWRFALDAGGDARLEGPRAGDVVTYDASAGLVRSAQHSASLGGDTLFYAERTGVAPGPPDQGPPNWILPASFGAYVRAALAAGDPAVHAVTYENRPAWQLDVAAVPNAVVPELSGDRFEITVDRATGLPVRVVETKHGSLLRELRIEDLAVDTTLPPATFRLAFPAGAEVMRSDDGFRRTTLAAAAALAPAEVPSGYRLAEAAAHGDVVSLAYRRGLDTFTVTVRPRPGGAVADPLASPPGFRDAEEPVRIDSGALAGADATLVLSPRTVPHVWALTGTRLVTVAGDLGRAELLQVAGSLRER